MPGNVEGVETKLQRIAEKARRDPKCRFTSLYLITAFALISILVSLPVYAQCPTTLSLDITSGPYLLVDHNKPGVEGPMVATMSVVITNTGASTAESVFVYIGDGITPGTFPPGSDSNRLAMLGGIGDATRYIVNLNSGQSKTIFWQLSYPPTDGQTYSFTVWADNESGCSVSASDTVTTRHALTASANKLLGTINLSPPSGVVNTGNLLTVTLTGFDFGAVGSGPGGEEDAWFQPVGNLSFNTTCFRLVRTEIYIHSIENVPPYNGMPLVDQVYLTEIRSVGTPPNYSYNATDYIEYTFIALNPCSTILNPYNEVASGTQEKYSGDYDESDTTITVENIPGNITFSKSVDPMTAAAGDTLTWTIEYGNTSDYPIGDPDTGNGLVVVDQAIPDHTTYVSGSANCSADCIIFYSTDNGTTWTTIEPAANNVTAIKWYINQIIPANTDPAGTTTFQTTVDTGTPPDTLICNSAYASIDEGAPLVTDSVCVNAPTPVCNITCDPVGCADCNQVIVTVNATGGKEPYTYLWNTGETSQSITVTSTGNYSVTVTDDNDCTCSANTDVTIYVCCSIGDTVFYDYNDNGVQDPGEPGIPGVEVNVYLDDGNGELDLTGETDELVCSLVTNADGEYICADLICTGTYWVQVVDSTLPPGLTLTTIGNPYGPVTFDHEGEHYDLADFGYDRTITPPSVPGLSQHGAIGMIIALACCVVWTLRKRANSRA